MKNNIYTIYLSFARSSFVAAIRRVVSPLFVVMFLAALVLWYVAKLSYTYTTEFTVKVHIEDQRFETKCVAEGVGTNLLGYHIYKGRALSIPIKELKYKSVTGKDSHKYLRLDEHSLSNAISMRYSDIKVVSIETPPDVLISERINEMLK